MVGSGPGDPDLLTVIAYKLLTTADSNTLIISDRLVSKEILELINVDNGVEVKIARKKHKKKWQLGKGLKLDVVVLYD